MKKHLTIFFFLLSICFIKAQTFNLTVTNGYGSGSYTAGDTVYIFSKELSTNESFNGWTFPNTIIRFLTNKNELKNLILLNI